MLGKHLDSTGGAIPFKGGVRDAGRFDSGFNQSQFTGFNQAVDRYAGNREHFRESIHSVN